MSDNFAARLKDDIIHTSSLADIAALTFEGMTYVAVGTIVAGVAILAAPELAAAGMTTAAASAVAVGESCVISGMIGGFIASMTGLAEDISEECSELATMLFPPSPAGKISTGAQNVLTNNLPAARAAGRVLTAEEAAALPPAEDKRDFISMLFDTGKAFLAELWDPTVDAPSSPVEPSGVDKVLCEKHPPEPDQYLAEGSASVTINDQPAVRGQDRTTCGATVSTVVSPNVIIGGESVVVRPVKSGKLPGLEILYIASSLFLGKPGKMYKQLPCLFLMAGGGMLMSRMGEEVYQLGRAIYSLLFPVHAATGAKVLFGEEDLDFALPARFPLTWQRIYNSRNLHEGLFGQGWRTEFETFVSREGALCCFHDAGGRELRFDSPAPGIQHYYADEGLIIACGEQGQMVIANSDGSVWRLYLPVSPDSDRLRLGCLSDEYGNGLIMAYDNQGRLETIRDTEDALEIRMEYGNFSQSGRVTKITEYLPKNGSENVLVQYSYDDAGCLAAIRDAEGRVRRRFTWTAENLLASHQMPEGLRCEYRWEKLDTWRVTEQFTSAGGHAVLQYDLDERLTTVRDELGYTRIHAWSEDFLPVRYTDEGGNDWHYTWNGLGLLTEHRDPQGSCWRYRYDEMGNLTEEEDAQGKVTLTSWLESRTLPETVKLPGGGVYHYDYDECHGLIRVVSPAGQQTVFTRDGYGQITAIKDSEGTLQRAGYNCHGQVTDITDCSGNTTRYYYNERHWMTEKLDATGESWHSVADASGYLLTVSGPDGWCEQMTYDQCGRLNRHVAADGKETYYTYDDTGWLIRRRDPRGGEVTRERDSRFRLTGLGNENGERWHFTFGANDRLKEEQAPDGAVTRYMYDNCGRPVSRTFLADTASALTWDMEYDSLGQMTALCTPDIKRTHSYTADGQLSETREVHRNGNDSRVAFDYDAAGRLRAEQGAWGTVSYQYDMRDNRTVTQLPDGRQIRSHYYGSGHLLHVALDDTILTEFTRDALHRETSRTQGSLFTQRRYDRLGRLSAMTMYRESSAQRPERETCCDYDLRHNVVREREMVKSPWPWREYGYDEVDNLVTYRTDGGRYESWRYDAAGNSLARGEAKACRYNRPAEVNGVRYRYDAHGRVTERQLYNEQQTLEYDSLHRLVRVTCRPSDWWSPERHVEYAYDGLNRRIRKHVHNVPRPGCPVGREYKKETRFLWEGLRLLSEEKEGQTVVYVYEGPGSYVPLARVDRREEKTRISWYHCQVNGAPARLTNESGRGVWRRETACLGATVSESGEVEENLRFQGQYLDRETGLHYNLFRYYDPDCGRFTQPDPIGLRGGLNQYAYGPNPLSWIDPLGLTKAPVYENPGHHDPGYLPNRQVPFNSTKSVIPSNAEEIFKLSQVDPDDPKTRWTKIGEGKKSVWHRFQSSAADGSGAFHWNGSTDGVDIKGKPRAIDIKNVPRSARNMKGCKL